MLTTQETELAEVLARFRFLLELAQAVIGNHAKHTLSPGLCQEVTEICIIQHH